jgi:hypothetical protein
MVLVVVALVVNAGTTVLVVVALVVNDFSGATTIGLEATERVKGVPRYGTPEPKPCAAKIAAASLTLVGAAGGAVYSETGIGIATATRAGTWV